MPNHNPFKTGRGQSIILAFLACLLILCAGCPSSGSDSAAQKPPSGDVSEELAQLTWLLGTWKHPQKSLYEEWRLSSPDRFAGRSYAVQEGDTAVSETLLLERRQGDIYYVATVPHNPGPVSFQLIAAQDSLFIFENLRHDFPTRIVYRRVSPDTLTVRIEGMRKGQPAGSDFWLVRHP